MLSICNANIKYYTNCFKGWVDDQCKNTCPCCRADVLSSSKQKMILQTKIDEFKDDVNYYRKHVRKERNKFHELNERNYELTEAIENNKKEIANMMNLYDRETEEYFRYKHQNDTTKKLWDNNPDIAIEWWKNKKKKLLHDSEAKHKGLTKELIKEIKQMSFKNEGFELMSENIFHNIKETNAAEEILRLFEEEEELGLDDCCNMFEEDDSTYTNGSELAVENRIIPNNTNNIRYDESEDVDTETDNSDIESMPGLYPNSDDDMSVISDDEDLLNESIDTIEITLPTIRTPSPIEEQTIRHNTSLQTLIDDNVTMRSFERRFLRSITRNLQEEFNIELATHFNSTQE